VFDDDVLQGEMGFHRRHRDELEALLGDDVAPGDDLVDVATIVHDIRSVYLHDERLPRGPALAAFTAAPRGEPADPAPAALVGAQGRAPQTALLPSRAEPADGSRRSIRAVGVLTAGLAGKVVLGAALVAASVGGLHAAGAVDVPGLPDRADERAVVDTREVRADEVADDDTSEAGAVGATADAPEAESDFSLAMQAWSECVDAASAAHDAGTTDRDASVDGPPGRFDPEAACGERPANPATSGQAGPPEEVARWIEALQGWAACVSETAPAIGSCERPNAPDASEEVPTEGPPSGLPAGPPVDAPAGPPASTPTGPPLGTPTGPPTGAPTG
jgi:hypothetical protein